MGFRSQAYANVWQTEKVGNNVTKVRISVNRKNKQTGEYEQDFSGFVSFVGSAVAEKALKLKKGERIKLGDVDVTTRYDKSTKATYTNFNVYSFETAAKNANAGDAEKDHSSSMEEDNRLPF